MANDTPFPSSQGDQTILVPAPGGSRRGVAPGRAPGAAASPPPGAGDSDGTGLALANLGSSPILGAAAPLIGLAIRLRTGILQDSVESLHDRVVGQISRFKERLDQMGLQPGVIRAAHYAVCATIDDVVLNTPWGGASLWPQQSLASVLHNEAVGGERFFVILDNVKRNPAGNLHLLELMYACLSIGFAGRFRLRPRGASELVELHNEVYQEICRQRGPRERDLSPAWAGLTRGAEPVHTLVPAWVSLAGGLVVAALVFTALLMRINEESDATVALLNKLPPTVPVQMGGREVSVTPDQGRRDNKVDALLAPEIRDHLVTVTETARTVTVSILASGMFASGSAEVRGALPDILRRVGQGLRDEPGGLTVAGHTDSRPIRTTAFPNNQVLSEARATAAAAILAAALGGQRPVVTVGYADSRPMADNASEEGRQQNRRIEVVLHKPLPTAAQLFGLQERRP